MTAVIVKGLVIGPVRPGDRRGLDGLFGACSAETVRRRFFGYRKDLPPAWVAAVCGGDAHRHDAVAARDEDGALVGIADLAADLYGGGASELAVLVADRWQRRGIATALVSLLLERARERGVADVTTSVLPDRSALLPALCGMLELQRLERHVDCVTAWFRVRQEVWT